MNGLAAEFRRAKETFEDDPMSIDPVTAIKENINRFHHDMMVDKRLTINQMVNAVTISRERVENILPNERCMSKISARWAHHLAPNLEHTRRSDTSSWFL